ncbi:Zn-ribbon domain-containing OB-fold protein [Rhodococcus aetherivorans]
MTATEPVSAPWGPAPDGLDQQYWDGLVAGELRLQRCTSCRTWIWGPQAICGHCHSFDIGWETVEPAGTVYSWNRSWYPYMEEYANNLPYVTVLVELPHAGGRRVLGILTDDIEADPAIGDRVVGSFERVEGSPWPLLRWRRAGANSEGEDR